jgi:hypothetical protein
VGGVLYRPVRAVWGLTEDPMPRDVAPVIAAEALLHRGLRDDVVMSYLARTWPLDDCECRDIMDAAHILLRREQFEDDSARHS